MSQAQKLHKEFKAAWGDLSKEFELDFNEKEYPHPETLVTKVLNNDIDRNVEVIYYSVGILLIQENGDDSQGRTGFVWLKHNQEWAKQAKQMVLEILA